MTISLRNLRSLNSVSNSEAWEQIINETVRICTQQIQPNNLYKQISERDQKIGILDLYISSCAWELWQHFETSVKRNSVELVEWWQKSIGSKAVLILDGLSLREIPWIVQGAELNGFKVSTKIHAAELPSDTNSFAKALGFSSRSQLLHNGAKNNPMFAPFSTDSVDHNWKGCIDLINSSPNWFFWHHWPDSKLHLEAGKGSGPEKLLSELSNHLLSEDFWEFIKKLAHGRSIVITSDHGYANIGLFTDVDANQTKFLKEKFGNSRFQKGDIDLGFFSPPIAMNLESQHNKHFYVVGRRKWRGPGGFPTLAHGGLSLLETLCPFIELIHSG